jgi:hypothetical protein
MATWRMCWDPWLVNVVLAIKHEAEPLHDKEETSMRLTFEVRQDIRRLVAIFGISLAFIVAQTVPPWPSAATGTATASSTASSVTLPRPILVTPTQTTTE